MENKDSQRGAETEVIELIANLIAAHSHHYELYQSLQSDIAHPDLWSTEQLADMIAESAYHNEKMEEITEYRRSAMRVLRNMSEEPNNKWHCLVKHSIACYQFAQELRDTDQDNVDYNQLAEFAYQYMYECISKYLGVELATC